MKRFGLQKMVLTILLGLFLSGNDTLYASCEQEVFNITSNTKGISILDVVSQLAKECDYNIVYKDNTVSKILGDTTLPTLNMKNMTLNEIFDFVLSENDIHYSYKNNLLKVGYVQTQTYTIHYLQTERTAKSTTSISISGSSTDSGDSSQKSGIDISNSDSYEFWKNLETDLKALIQFKNDYYKDASVIVNKGAGMITATGSQQQLSRIEKYVTEFSETMNKQVMIDVHLLQVTHANKESLGINWQRFGAALGSGTLDDGTISEFGMGTFDGTAKVGGEFSEVTGDASLSTSTAGTLTRSYTNFATLQGAFTLNGVINFLKQYGEVTAISNPKVMTLNNQAAVISVGTTYSYNESVDKETDDSTGDVTYTTTPGTIFSGVLLDITPSIHGNSIMLRINPSITDVDTDDYEERTDATNPIAGEPKTNTKQLASIVKVRNGEKVILGGLIEKDETTTNTKVPLLGDLPIIGRAFNHDEISKTLDETVIIIMPHIIENEHSVSLKDLGFTIAEYE